MLVGPVFNREVTIAPRRPRLYVARTAYASALLVLMLTAWLVLKGTQLVRDVGDLARFGSILFQILAPLQLALAIFSAMLAASAVAQEKDRRTLELLLLTNLSNSELVLGKLLASLLQVLVMLAASVPILVGVTLLGGVSLGQIGRVLAVVLASILACGSLGSTLALWREKTFQALAMTVLALVLWLALCEVVASGAVGASLAGVSCDVWAAAGSPWRAVLEATRPSVQHASGLGVLGGPVPLFIGVAVLGSLVLNGIAIARVRVWNPPREAQPIQREEEPHGQTSLPIAPQAVAAKEGRTRPVWDNPVLWREVCTWAYGRRMLVIRAAYVLLFALAAASLHWMIAHHQLAAYAGGMVALVPLSLLSLVLVNAQAVTAITSERDARALDLLLVTDLTPKEVVFGKLGGIFYNTKEMVVLPMLLWGYLGLAGAVGLENLLYVLGGLAVLYVFVAMLGVHAGMIYANSRAAVGTSLGTVFFLFVGVATCMWMMITFSGSFEVQLFPFAAMFLGGGLGLYVALGARNPSTAIGLAAFLCPFATFYAITSISLGSTLGVFLVVVAAYGFTTAAMLIPAIYEFDVETGRTIADDN